MKTQIENTMVCKICNREMYLVDEEWKCPVHGPFEIKRYTKSLI